MFDLNKVQFIGRIGRDPESRKVGDKTVVNFSLATSYGTGDKKKTDWHQISAWEKLGEIALQILHKGDMVYVEGRLNYNTTGEGDTKKIFPQITATNLISLTGKPAGTGSTGNTNTSSVAVADEDIPF